MAVMMNVRGVVFWAACCVFSCLVVRAAAAAPGPFAARIRDVYKPALVQLIHRHGERSPMEINPKDRTAWHCYLGELQADRQVCMHHASQPPFPAMDSAEIGRLLIGPAKQTLSHVADHIWEEYLSPSGPCRNDGETGTIETFLADRVTQRVADVERCRISADIVAERLVRKLTHAGPQVRLGNEGLCTLQSRNRTSGSADHQDVLPIRQESMPRAIDSILEPYFHCPSYLGSAQRVERDLDAVIASFFRHPDNLALLHNSSDAAAAAFLELGEAIITPHSDSVEYEGREDEHFGKRTAMGDVARPGPADPKGASTVVATAPRSQIATLLQALYQETGWQPTSQPSLAQFVDAVVDNYECWRGAGGKSDLAAVDAHIRVLRHLTAAVRYKLMSPREQQQRGFDFLLPEGIEAPDQHRASTEENALIDQLEMSSHVHTSRKLHSAGDGGSVPKWHIAESFRSTQAGYDDQSQTPRSTDVKVVPRPTSEVVDVSTDDRRGAVGDQLMAELTFRMVEKHVDTHSAASKTILYSAHDLTITALAISLGVLELPRHSSVPSAHPSGYPLVGTGRIMSLEELALKLLLPPFGAFITLELGYTPTDQTSPLVFARLAWPRANDALSMLAADKSELQSLFLPLSCSAMPFVVERPEGHSAVPWWRQWAVTGDELHAVLKHIEVLQSDHSTTHTDADSVPSYTAFLEYLRGFGCPLADFLQAHQHALHAFHPTLSDQVDRWLRAGGATTVDAVDAASSFLLPELWKVPSGDALVPESSPGCCHPTMDFVRFRCYDFRLSMEHTHPVCQQWRINCPETACGPGYVATREGECAKQITMGAEPVTDIPKSDNDDPLMAYLHQAWRQVEAGDEFKGDMSAPMDADVDMDDDGAVLNNKFANEQTGTTALLEEEDPSMSMSWRLSSLILALVFIGLLSLLAVCCYHLQSTVRDLTGTGDLNAQSSGQNGRDGERARLLDPEHPPSYAGAAGVARAGEAKQVLGSRVRTSSHPMHSSKPVYTDYFADILRGFAEGDADTSGRTAASAQ